MSLFSSSSGSSAALRQLYRQPPRLAHCFSHSARAARTAQGQRLVLGIETSCDDSCVALVRAPPAYGSNLAHGGRSGKGGAHVVASVVLRQDHGATGGIEPLAAAHEHAARLPSALLQALEQAREAGEIAAKPGAVPTEIDAIAVTQGPGMPGCLSSGLAMAKTLSALWDRPLIYVHHMAAHALTPFLTSPKLRFPYLSLLLSGGHSQLVLVRGLDDYEILADATDGAIGNAFDKVARELGAISEWSTKPPGRQLEELAERGYVHEKRLSEERVRLGLPTGRERPPKETWTQKQRRLRAQAKAETGELDEQGGQGEQTEGKEREMEEEQRKEEAAGLPALPLPHMRELPVPFRGVPAFSFGGLKEAACAEIRRAQAEGHYDERWRSHLAREFQSAAFAQLRNKLHMALEPATARSRLVPHTVRGQQRQLEGNMAAPRIHILDARLDLGMPRENIKHLVLAGGVASNEQLRRVLRSALDHMKRPDVELCFPPIRYCTDNAAMIAHAGLLQWAQRTRDMRRFPRGKWSLADLRPPAQQSEKEAAKQQSEAAKQPPEAQQDEAQSSTAPRRAEESRASRALRDLDLGPGLGGM